MKRSHFALPEIYGEPMSFYEILNKLGKLLGEETLDRKQYDDKLKHDSGTEASAREQADTTLQQNINAEKTELSELKSDIADKATLENGVVKFWKTSTEENRTDTLLYSVDISSIGGTGGLDLENLTLSVSQVGNYQRLSMSDGTTTKNVDIPIITITDEQVSTAVQKYLEENPVSALDASTAETNQVPVADGNGNWSWQTQQSGTGSDLITEERVNELINAKLPKSAEEVQY